MWDRASTRTPVAAFALPPHPPAPVATAFARFDGLAEQWGRLRGERLDADQQATDAKAAASRALADWYASGSKGKRPDPAEVAQTHAERIVTLDEQIGALSVALDEAGNELAHAIVAHRAEWLELLDQAAEVATSRYQAAVAEARQALQQLAPARGAVGWLQRFELGPAIVGQQAQFSGGRLYVDSRDVVREVGANPITVLDVLERVTADNPHVRAAA